MSCPHIRSTGEPCGRPVGRFDRCFDHRERAASKPSRPCSSCGKPTKRDGGLCIGRACGWNAYRRELAQRKKAAAAAAQSQAAKELAASERDRRAEEAAEEVADALAGLRPWPSWVGMTLDEFDARGTLEAERDAEQARAQDAAAALVEALQAAEAEAAAAADRDRAAREQLDRLRRAYAACAATRLGPTLVPAGAALAR